MEGTIAVDDPRTDDVRRLLETHVAFGNAHSPPEDVHALDVEGLLDPAITFCSYRLGGELLGVGAIKDLGDGQAELKSMHTAEGARGRGVGRAMVDHLVALARERGMTRLSLETGTPDVFAPARGLYASVGFVPCGPFGAYAESGYSCFFTLDLTAG
ncbi:GNAT family N-acetyltransferase [Nocardioides sp. CN2-186]|uniref:GNAT family N-acetyltransferase n=1 Tax=Nocardioides tweenelious TaxID=3156607 RepID=UPI0032B52646